MTEYIIRDSESGNTIESTDSLTEAVQIIKRFEAEDRKEGQYTPDFYEVYDPDRQEIVEI